MSKRRTLLDEKKDHVSAIGYQLSAIFHGLRYSTVLNAIWVLTRAQLLIVRNTFWRGKIRRKIGLVILRAVVGLLAFGLYSLMRASVRFITSPAFMRALERAAREQPNPGIPTDIRPFLEALPSVAL